MGVQELHRDGFLFFHFKETSSEGWLSLSFSVYIYVYICRTVGLGTAFFQKTWRFGVHLRAGSGSTRVSQCKNRHFRGKTRQPKTRQKITNCPPHGPRAQFCGKRTPEFLHGTAERDFSLTGCCPYENSVFWGHIVQRYSAYTNLKNICV